MVRARTAVPEDLGSSPSIFMAAQSSLQLQFHKIRHPLLLQREVDLV